MSSSSVGPYLFHRLRLESSIRHRPLYAAAVRRRRRRSGDHLRAALPPINLPLSRASRARVLVARGGRIRPARGQHGRQPELMTSADVSSGLFF